MNILESSYIVKLINAIDLSNKDEVENSVKQSSFIKLINGVYGKVKSLLDKFTRTSLLSRYIDYLILANLAVLFIAITFTPTIIQGALVATALILTFARWFLVPGEGHNFTNYDIPTMIYVGVAIVAVGFSSYFMPSLKGLAKVLIYFAIYIAATNVFRGASWKVYFVLVAIAITGGLEAIYGLYQQVTGVEALATWQDPDAIKADQNMDRIYGSLEPFNPNLLAGYLLPILPVTAGVATLALFKKQWHWTILFYGMSFATLLALVFTGSRGAYIGVAGMCAVAYFIAGHLIWHEFSESKFSKWLKWGWLAAGIGGIAVVVLALLTVPALQDRVMSIFTLRGHSSNSYRMNVYMSSFEMFKDNWLIGIGPGNTTFRLVYGLYMITGFDALGAYSVPLEIAVEMGIVGLLAFLWLLLVVFSNAIKKFLSTTSLEVKILIATILVAFVGIAGQGMFDTIWFRPQVHIIFWTLVAMLGCIVNDRIKFNGNGK